MFCTKPTHFVTGHMLLIYDAAHEQMQPFLDENVLAELQSALEGPAITYMSHLKAYVVAQETRQSPIDKNQTTFPDPWVEYHSECKPSLSFLYDEQFITDYLKSLTENRLPHVACHWCEVGFPIVRML